MLLCFQQVKDLRESGALTRVQVVTGRHSSVMAGSDVYLEEVMELE
jgi:hypothetical protein